MYEMSPRSHVGGNSGELDALHINVIIYFFHLVSFYQEFYILCDPEKYTDSYVDTNTDTVIPI